MKPDMILNSQDHLDPVSHPPDGVDSCQLDTQRCVEHIVQQRL